MYVGDDQAVEAAGTLSTPLKIAIALVAGWLLFARR